MDWLKGAAGTVAGAVSGATGAVTGGIGKGISKLADKAANSAADAALAPLNLIEKSLGEVSKLGPDIVANRRAAINNMLSGIEDAALKYDNDVATKKRAEATAIIEARVKQVEKDTSIPNNIKDKFADILKNKDATPEDLLDELANAEDDLRVYENKEFNGWRLVKRAWRFASDYIYYILLFICAIFGGIIMSNTYIHETFLPIRIYYFFYGTVFFPISLIYGIMNPPEWNATIFPLFQLPANPVTVAPNAVAKKAVAPKVGGAPPTLSAAEAAGMASAVARGKATYGAPPSLATQALTEATATGQTPVEAAKEAVNVLEVAGVTTQVAEQQVAAALQSKGVPAEEAMRAVKVPYPLSIMQRVTIVANVLFGYKTGGSTLVIRLISIILAVTTSIWAYSRDDLDELIYIFRGNMGVQAKT